MIQGILEEQEGMLDEFCGSTVWVGKEQRFTEEGLERRQEKEEKCIQNKSLSIMFNVVKGLGVPILFAMK